MLEPESITYRDIVALLVSADILESVDPIFFGDLRTAAFKALGLT